MAKSGCRQILIGFESPSADGLQGMNPNDWKLKRHKSYIESINKIQSKGVSVNGCFIVGLDSDTPETFNQIKQFADEAKLIEIQITVYTPFPGTPLYHRLKNENRLLQDENWDRCTLFDVNFKPKNMSLEQLEDGIKWLFKNLYNEDEFLKRKRYYMEYIKNIDD